MKTQMFKTTFIVLMASFFGQFQVSGQVAVNKKQIAIVWPVVLRAAGVVDGVNANGWFVPGGSFRGWGPTYRKLNPPVQLTNAYLNKSVKGLRFGGGVNSQLNDEGLKIITRFQQVKYLSISGSIRITDAGLKEVAKLKNLEYLDLFGCVNITDAGLREISKLQKLRCFELTASKITDAGLKHLAKMQNLNELNLSGNNISNAGLKELVNKLPRLGILNLRFRPFKLH